MYMQFGEVALKQVYTLVLCCREPQPVLATVHQALHGSSPLPAIMLRSQFRCLCLFAVASACSADSLGSQLRGTAAAAPAQATVQGETPALNQLQHTDCGCNHGVCTCLRSNSSLAEAEEQWHLEESLLNRTQVVREQIKQTFLWFHLRLRVCVPAAREMPS